MKSKLNILLLLCIFTAAIMVGCGSQNNNVVNSNVNLEENIMNITEWPQTASLI